ncbi:MAG: hypothetical protein H6667_06905 [Ardenticatenaceae bacterium]|nr:hypothetical protein [Ardenticatenaceae bacterium]MCB9445086.1 hypothetical protein [Ardenticatenaceae bacterium]
MSKSPLEIIRHKEAEVTRRLASERETAVSQIKSAEQQARELVRQAEEEGQREGAAQHQTVLNQAALEAEAILAQAEGRAQALRNVSPVQMETAVTQAMTIITGLRPSEEEAI